MCNNLTFKILTGRNITDEFFNIFYSFLQESMLKVEYRSFEGQKALIQKDNYRILFCSKEDRVVGVMALWTLENFTFIEHFAVDKSLRGQGIGTKMIDFIKFHINTSVILEVELPYNEMNKRRIDFYKRNGFNYNDYEYYQMPLNKDDEPLELRIMSYPEALTAQRFETVRKNLIEDVYNSSNYDKIY